MNTSTTPAWPLPFWIAHRGAGKLAPENTLAAFRLGAAHGYRAFECDVKLSQDGIPFLLHDSSLRRTSTGSGLASAQSWSDLSRLDAGSWHSRSYAGEPLASLEAVVRFVQANGFGLNLELKPTPGQERLTGQVVGREVLRLWQGQARLPLFSSFEPVALEGARETAPGVPRGLLLDSPRESWLAEAQSLGCVALITNYRLMDAARVQAIHAAGMKALVYTANDASVVAWLRANGVDGIITDAVDRFAPGD